jgi:hypothetical protein
LQRRFEIIGYLFGDNLRRRQRVSIRQALILYPEQVKAELIAL